MRPRKGRGVSRTTYFGAAAGIRLLASGWRIPGTFHDRNESPGLSDSQQPSVTLDGVTGAIHAAF
jgi:hypothetical protein